MGWTVDWHLRGWMAVVAAGIVATVLLALVVEFVLFLVLLFVLSLAFSGLGLESIGGWVTVLGVLSFPVYVVAIAWSAFTAVPTERLVAAPTRVETGTPLADRARRLAAAAGLPAPTVVVAEAAEPFAFTAGFRPSASRIVVSTGLLGELSDAELDAVLAHELAHVANRDAAVMTAGLVPARLMAYSPTKLVPALFVYGPNYLVRGLAVFLARLLGRKREYAADDGAVAITGSPAALAGALETLDEATAERPTTDRRFGRELATLSIVPSGDSSLRRGDIGRHWWRFRRRYLATHPPTERRIERLRSRVRSMASTDG